MRERSSTRLKKERGESQGLAAYYELKSVEQEEITKSLLASSKLVFAEVERYRLRAASSLIHYPELLRHRCRLDSPWLTGAGQLYCLRAVGINARCVHRPLGEVVA